MKASELLEIHKAGTKILGKRILTPKVGEWPGGPADIIKVSPHPKAPEIVFQVRHAFEKDPDNPSNRWEIGVFEHEEIWLWNPL